MALSANTVWEVRSVGSDTNGGGYVTGSTGTDFSQQNSPNSSGSNQSTTNVVATGTTTLTSTTAAFTSALIGNIIYLAGGSGSLVGGWYQVSAVLSATTITVDRAVATGTGITMNIGGAMASIGQASVPAINGNVVYIKSGTYSITTATGNISGGAIGNSLSVVYVGYNTNRTMTNRDTSPILNYTVSGVSMFSARGTVYNLSINGNGQTTAAFQGANDENMYYWCTIEGMNSIPTSSGASYFGCYATGNSVTVFRTTQYAMCCEAAANSATPYAVGMADFCLSYNNTGSTTDGFDAGVSVTPTSFKNCIAYGNGRDGFGFLGSSRGNNAVNCHAENNAGFGFNFGTSLPGQTLINCSAYNNTSGAVSSNTKMSILNFITVTAGTVFVSPGTLNFALNNFTNQGLLLHAAGSLQVSASGNTSSFIDIGVSQHNGVSDTNTLASTFG